MIDLGLVVGLFTRGKKITFTNEGGKVFLPVTITRTTPSSLNVCNVRSNEIMYQIRGVVCAVSQRKQALPTIMAVESFIFLDTCLWFIQTFFSP